jgi:CelD/BcsL family acetyltransferase involved in cellulose biosynthesis
MGFVHCNRYSYLKTSFDERYKPASPATVLRARLIELLIDDGIKVFDFPGEPYSWEKQWTKEVRWHKSLVIYNNTLLGRIYNTLTIVKDALGTRGNNNAGDGIDYHDPKDLKAPGN